MIVFRFNIVKGFNLHDLTKSNMNHQQDNLLRLINKYSLRFGEHDPLVLDLKKEVIDLQSRQEKPIVFRSKLFQSNVTEIEFVQRV